MTRDEIEEKLNLWQTALDRIATEGQEVQIGKVRYRFADIDFIQKMIAFYTNELARVNRGSSPGMKLFRIVPMGD